MTGAGGDETESKFLLHIADPVLKARTGAGAAPTLRSLTA